MSRRIPVLVHAVNVVAVLLAAAFHPLFGKRVWAALTLAVAAVDVVALLGPRLWLDRLDGAFRRSATAKNLALALSSLLFTLGAAELLAKGLVVSGIVEAYSAMRTVVGPGEDWRLAHITADEYREPDPVLLWRNVDRWPYTSQRFKGPEVDPEKPPGTFRILCYGDSNTDGPVRGGWPERLQDVLDERHPSGPDFEVLNAGVAGYSSRQGLLRFRQEAENYRPDLVLVSFGWNDAVRTGTPDAEYPVPQAAVVALERVLLRYTLYWVARRLRDGPTPSGAELLEVSRVPRAQYLANMRGFLRTARRAGAEAAFLTRPHMPIPETTTWRGEVPKYNRTLLAFGRRSGATVLDAFGAFTERPELFADECHLTAEGHDAMADFLYRGLREHGLLPGSDPGRAGS